MEIGEASICTDMMRLQIAEERLLQVSTQIM